MEETKNKEIRFIKKGQIQPDILILYQINVKHCNLQGLGWGVMLRVDTKLCMMINSK